MSPSSALHSPNHLPGKNWHPFKSPGIHCSAGCSLTSFSQTDQTRLKTVNSSKQSTHMVMRQAGQWSAPVPFPSPLSPCLPTKDQHLLSLNDGGVLLACFVMVAFLLLFWFSFVFNTSHFRAWGMPQSYTKKNRH